ncbi:hypothetical protein GGQ80_003048 [Sphingomonas jinjuensis]|uniref:Type I phosphodiesterase / nucleotide pyrophosphatase n=1 Tax=Sphingomonas jinjuensis TaxID=535907 RepID=A0A840FE83_9SPHN|nr:hypothetical protein [Sphingomonas jinjuensis]MBB4155131.1 hypothetical protein [Sphingomonas jinjuensis]
MTVLLLELNEINFDQVRGYVAQGKLPALGRLIADHGLSETTSETKYEELEPWIQWVTAHTGLTLAEHGVFRLGDILATDIDQIWEVLERQGVSVGAISPMNAKNRCRNAAFFVPDPWTRTRVSGSPMLERLYQPIAQAVNDNAEGKITAASAVNLVAGMARYARPGSYAGFVRDTLAAVRGRPWRKAMVLDRLLADVFIRETRAKKPGFASLFLNAGAHIQHHYLFSSTTYGGPFTNPTWYVPEGVDPVLEVYELYDAIVGDVVAAFPQARVMLATGLHQDPHGAVTWYWRLRDHAQLLKQAGVPFARVEPRMSQDFVVFCHDAAEAARAEARLTAMVSDDGEALFSVDNRGDSLFVSLVWPHDIPSDFVYQVDGTRHGGLRDMVAFVALKNGKHNAIGYFLDSGAPGGERFALADVPRRIAEACGKRWAPEPPVLHAAAE